MNDGTTAGPHRSWRPAPALQFHRVSFHYPSRLGRRAHRVLEHISFELGTGDVLGVIGGPHSGKTTLARVAAGILLPSRGSVKVSGVDPARLGSEAATWLRSRVGFVQQDPNADLGADVTVGEIIAARLVDDGATDGPLLTARVRRLLDEVALPAGSEHVRPSELPPADRRRVAIARAVALRPDLLITDDLTNGLEVSAQGELLELLLGLHDYHDFACLFIGADPAVVNEVGDSVFVLSHSDHT